MPEKDLSYTIILILAVISIQQDIELSALSDHPSFHYPASYLRLSETISGSCFRR